MHIEYYDLMSDLLLRSDLRWPYQIWKKSNYQCMNYTLQKLFNFFIPLKEPSQELISFKFSSYINKAHQGLAIFSTLETSSFHPIGSYFNGGMEHEAQYFTLADPLVGNRSIEYVRLLISWDTVCSSSCMLCYSRSKVKGAVIIGRYFMYCYCAALVNKLTTLLIRI